MNTGIGTAAAILRKSIRLCLLTVVVLIAACSDDPELPPLTKDATILAFGDSLTWGSGARGTSYPKVLQQLTGLNVVNAGVPGEISSRGLKRLPLLLAQHEPALVILCHGGNDILRRMSREAMQNNIEAMVKRARDAGAEVVLVGVPEFSLFLSATEQHDDIAEKLELPYVRNSLSDILKKPQLKSDQIHPNADGYRQMAEDIHTLLVETGALTQ